MARTAPLPRSSPIVASQVDPSTGRAVLTGYISSAWDTYFQLSQIPRIEASPERLSTVDTGSKTAAISTTALPIGSVTAGLYRVTYYARITTAASTSRPLGRSGRSIMRSRRISTPASAMRSSVRGIGGWNRSTGIGPRWIGSEPR